MKGLVLEGGAMRGIFTAGALDAFEELGITFDQCSAISAGALNALSFLSHQKGRNLTVSTKYANDPRYFSFRNWVKTGTYFGTKMLFETIPDELEPFDYEAFRTNPCKLEAGVFNIETGELEFKHIQDAKKDRYYLQAAAALPVFSAIVQVDGHKYLDGGIVDCFGLDHTLESGCNKVIVIHTRDAQYRRGPAKFLKLIGRIYSKYPKIVENMRVRPERYNASVRRFEQMEKEGKLILIRPKNVVTVGRMEKDQEKLRNLYQEGYDIVMERKEEILAYLNKK